MAIDDQTMQELFDYLDGHCVGAARESLERRLADDAALRDELERLRRYRTLMSEVARTQDAAETAWPALDRAVANRIESLQSSRSSLGLMGLFGRPLFAAGLASVLVVLAYVGVRELRRPTPNPGSNRTRAIAPRPADSVVLSRRGFERAPSLTLARIDAVKGTLLVRVEGTPRALVPGQSVVTRHGQRFIVGDASEASIRLGKHRVVLKASTDVELVAHSSAVTHLRLRRGSVLSEVARRGPKEEYRVDAGAYKVVVKGTRFSVTLDPETQKVRVKVFHGRVVVASRLGKSPDRVLVHDMDETFDEPPTTTMRLGKREVEAPKTPIVAPAPRQTPTPRRLRVRRRAPRPTTVAQTQRRKLKRNQERPIVHKKPRKEILIVVPRQQMGLPPTPPSPRPTPETRLEVSRILRQAVLAAEKGRCADALVVLQPMLTAPRQGGYADALYVAGYCHAKLGRRAESRRFMRAYLRIAPRGRWIRKAGDLINPPRPTLRRLQSQP
ncbi:MAG: FecR domain-containing protein [Myxococcales bacterium]|nr:FecR domain-containing protein [Myxococcales bacterium]